MKRFSLFEAICPLMLGTISYADTIMAMFWSLRYTGRYRYSLNSHHVARAMCLWRSPYNRRSIWSTNFTYLLRMLIQFDYNVRHYITLQPLLHRAREVKTRWFHIIGRVCGLTAIPLLEIYRCHDLGSMSGANICNCDLPILYSDSFCNSMLIWGSVYGLAEAWSRVFQIMKRLQYTISVLL